MESTSDVKEARPRRKTAGGGKRGLGRAGAPATLVPAALPAPRSPLPAFRRFAPLLVALVASLVFANALGNDFALDDRGVILRNPLVQSIDGVWRAFGNPYWPREASDAGVYRPLAIASYALDWALTDGSARWMHALNILWHAAAAVLVWYLAAQLLAPAGALAAALLFAVHPVHVEAVANVVGRAECMAAVFVLGALLAHRRGSWLAPALLLLGLFSKESAVAFVALAPAADLLLSRDPSTTFRQRRALYAAYAGVVAIYAATLVAVFHGREFTQIAPVFHGLSVAQRLLTVATIIPEYPRLLLAPLNLSWDYSPNVIAPAHALTLRGVAGVAVLLVYALLLARVWRRDRVLAFCMLWVPIAIGPVANVIVPTGIAVAERTLYLASVGVVLVAGWLVQRWGVNRQAPVVAAICVVALLFAVRSWTRTPVWRNNQTLALDLLARHPESYRAHQAVARVYAGMGRWREADSAYRTSRTLFQRDATVYREAAAAAARLGRLTEARALVDSALALEPDYGEAQALRSELALEQGTRK
jgi:tetratricopeptide (TPR) repeat protein